MIPRAARSSHSVFLVLAVTALACEEAPALAATQGHAHADGKAILMRGAAEGGGQHRGAGDRRDRTLGSLPATFTGLLPCPDCAGIRYQINLLPGGAYMQRMTYLRDGHDDSYYEVGAWSLSGDGGTLDLDGGRQAIAHWAVKDKRTLRKLDVQGNPIDSNLPDELRRSGGVEGLEPRVRLTGMFRYVADAARFRDCRSGLQWPVAMTGDYRALERAYTSRRVAPGAELMVSLNGRIEERARTEGAGNVSTLVVEKFGRAMPGERCEGSASGTELENSRWRLVRVGDRVVAVSGQSREPWVEFDSGSRRVTGSGGCNRIGGSFVASDGTLRVGPLVSTRMACPSVDLEASFLRALGGTRRYRILGRMLVLMDDSGKVLARLEARKAR